MAKVSFPYGKEFLEYGFDEKSLLGVLESSIEEYIPECSAEELVKRAMEKPVGSPRLSELAKGKKNIVIIASDHTRPVPSKVIIPPMLEEIKSVNPDADITVLIATGCHRGTTREELVAKFGEDVLNQVNIYVHDCDERDKLVNLGVLPSGGDCEVNSIAVNADLLIAEGFIEPHFFAGFSGGRKSVLPGVCGRNTVLSNHCAEFIADGNSRTGILDGNPIHKDMIWAAETAKLCYIVNVVLNAEKEVIYAVAGDTFEAHKKGVDFLREQCGAKAKPADIVLTTNGGYPLDQNVYQSVKGMTAAEATVKDGGVIIMMAKAGDGVGGDHFYRQMAEESDLNKIMDELMSRGRNETLPDQWMTQILTRILLRASVIYISDAPDNIIRDMHMIPAHSIDEAMKKAKEILGREDVTVTAIPDGVAVVVER
ncbi:MAG: nickel-dependent lactate racemase [Clostridia bacterium]|nr:nickel-dependent lactate racemase [Clostridia bacterium]